MERTTQEIEAELKQMQYLMSLEDDKTYKALILQNMDIQNQHLYQIARAVTGLLSKINPTPTTQNPPIKKVDSTTTSTTVRPKFSNAPTPKHVKVFDSRKISDINNIEEENDEDSYNG